MQENLKFSIITVCYNAVETIEKTILSVREQSFKNFEHIIIDGSSTDGTLDIIAKYKDGFSIVICEPDQGIYDAMNKGIKLAKGEYISILNADDFYFKDTLKILSLEIKNQKIENTVYYGNMLLFTKTIKDGYIIKPGTISKLKEYMCLNHPTCFLSHNLYEKFLYNKNFKFAADQDLFLKLSQNKEVNFIYIDKLITAMRSGGASSNPKSFFEIWKVQKQHNISFPIRIRRLALFYLHFCFSTFTLFKPIKNFYRNFISKRHLKYRGK